jgi:perosamine synthetase
MHLALEALGVGVGHEVIVPSMTFAATGEVVRYVGARPRLVDVRAGDHTLDIEALERAITPQTKAVIPVHFAGQACEMGPLLELARAHNFFVVEDAAHAFPAAYEGRPVGSLGDITCFSFYATKTITTGEGGLAATGREDWAERMRVMSLHGISKDAWKRYSAEGSWYYEILAPGFKYNMTDIAAALGLVQMARADAMLNRRRAIARRYLEAFADDSALELLDVREFDEHAWHLFVVKLRPGVTTLDRNAVVQKLMEAGVGSSVHFIPLHLHPYYRDEMGCSPNDFPVARDCYERSFSVPIYSRLSDDDVDRVIDVVTTTLKQHRR